MVFRAFVLNSLQSHLCAFEAQPYVCVKSFAQPTNGVGVLLGLKTPPTLVSSSPRPLLTECPGLLEGPRAQPREGENGPNKGRAENSGAGPHQLAGPSIADSGECWAEGEKEGMIFLRGIYKYPNFCPILLLSVRIPSSLTLLPDEVCIWVHIVPFTILITKAL